MEKQKNYQTELQWTGNKGLGTASYKQYDRDHQISVLGKPSIPGSSDPDYRGDCTRYNPEELLVASLSACHMLWYLHLCSDAGVIVTKYQDKAVGRMRESEEKGGWFEEVQLNPKVTVAEQHMVDKANQLHDKAHGLCFIANSVNFPVIHVAYAEASNVLDKV